MDTNVVSAGSPVIRQRGHVALIDWMDQQSARLYLPVIAVAEIINGISKARREGATRKAMTVEAWLGDVLHLYGSRTLDLDLMAAHSLGELSDHARARGITPGWPEIAIAAIARAHGLVVLTRNARHFAPLGIPTHDPYASLPE